MTDPFVSRVLRMSAGASAVIALGLVGIGRVREGASFALGAIVSIAVLQGIRFSVDRVLQPGRPRMKRAAAIAAVARYGIVAAILAAVVHWRWVSLPAFAVGIGMVQFVIVLKGFGMMLAGNHPARPLSERLSLKR